MGMNSNIRWTDHTWNPWQGCHKVSAGCKNCYMYRDKKRFGKNPQEIIISSITTFNKPKKWYRSATVFTCSWSDFFIKEADKWRPFAWDIIEMTLHLIYLILTKRPENIKKRLPDGWPHNFKNVWLGVTAENQEMADLRIPILMEIPSVKKFVSIEPMLGQIDLTKVRKQNNLKINYLYKIRDKRKNFDFSNAESHSLDWVICGGESGPNNRPIEIEWIEKLKKDCQDYGVPFFMKQMSGNAPIPEHLKSEQFPI